MGKVLNVPGCGDWRLATPPLLALEMSLLLYVLDQLIGKCPEFLGLRVPFKNLYSVRHA